MGNHNVGHSMTAFAVGFWNGRGHASPPTQDEALKLLDIAAEDFVGADAEFDDELDAESPLGRLIAIAFDWQEGVEDGEGEESEDDEKDEEDPWFFGPVAKFRERYKFC